MVAKSDPSDLDKLSHALHIAKEAEKAARDNRIEIENEIVKKFGEDLHEGTSKFSGSYYEASIKCGMTRKITDITGLKKTLPQEMLEKLVKPKFDLSTSYLKKLQDCHPALYKECAKYIEAKWSKPQISVKEIL